MGKSKQSILGLAVTDPSGLLVVGTMRGVTVSTTSVCGFCMVPAGGAGRERAGVGPCHGKDVT